MKIVTIALAFAVVLLAMHSPKPVTSQQKAPCVNSANLNRSDKQEKLDACSCEQSAASDKPTYRVGASPFGRKAATRNRSQRVGQSTRARARNADEDPLYNGIEMPNLKDLRSPEVVGLKERLASAREAAKARIERIWQKDYRRAFEIEMRYRDPKYFKDPDKYFKKEPSFQLDPVEFLKPEVFGEVLENIRQHGHQFAAEEREYNRFKKLIDTEQLAALSRFDWREQGLDVGAVMNQGDCESCWAFAAVTVYQSSWYLKGIRSGEYFESVLNSDEPPEYQDRFASVQQLLNCIGDDDKGSCTGGWHGTAFALMVDSHVPHIPDRVVSARAESGKRDAFAKVEVEGYTGKKSRCVNLLQTTRVKRGGQPLILENGGTANVRLQANTDRIATPFDRALAWGYVNEKKPDELPTVEQLKQALVEYGPVVGPLRGDNCFSVYQGGVFNGRNIGDPTHDVVIIGWDDEKQAWLIKNSWGEEWGEKGFGWMAYGSNNIGRFAAWIQPTPYTDVK
jgi:hypothetical protein